MQVQHYLECYNISLCPNKENTVRHVTQIRQVGLTMVPTRITWYCILTMHGLTDKSNSTFRNKTVN